MIRLIDMIDDSISDSADVARNEDCLLLSDNIVGVIDGATPVHALGLEGFSSSAEWLVTEFNKMFNDFPKNNVEFGLICSRIMNQLSTKIDVSWNDYDKPCFVSATVTLLHDRSIQIDVLGDCSVYVLHENDRIELITDGRVDKYANLTLQKVIEARKQGANIHEAIEKQKIKNRMMMNKKDGYWTVGFKGNFPNEFVKKSIDLSSVKALLLCTDGFARAFREFGIVKPVEVLNKSLSLTDVLCRIRKYECENSHNIDFPCVKKSDDATAVLLSF